MFWFFLLSSHMWYWTPLVLLPGESHGRRSLVDCSPEGREESDMTEWLHFHFSLSCIGEGNDNPLQCSCLENPRDGGAWWAAIYGVAQSQTPLKWLSSSSSSEFWGFPGSWAFQVFSGERIHLLWRRYRQTWFPWVRKIPWKRAWQPTPVSLPGVSHGQSSQFTGSQRVGHDWSDRTCTQVNFLFQLFWF